MLLRRVFSVTVLLLGCASLPGNAARAGDVDFNRDIRPILSRNCFDCHGPDSKQRKADLRLDTRAGAFADLGGHLAFVPGKPNESEALRRMTAADPDERMPPSKTGKKPSPAQIELIRRWIAEGAKWSEHWSYVPPKRPPVPAVRDADWPRNAIDEFILTRLKQERLEPAPEADKVSLLRRLSLDLIGLPPTVAEVDAFLADTNAGACSRQADRLLASPHYGERWGRLWLDAARYADSDGYEKDKSRQVWFYRDWVTGALNRDLPYDQFIIDQIAGDELSHATQDQIVATGFLRNSMLNEEGGVDPEQFRMEAMFDRMDAIGKSVLGLTIQCAQCHNHKYDPLTQEEYYRLFAFLNNDYEANIAVYTPDEQRRRADLFRRIHELEAGLRHRHADWSERMAHWEETVRNDQPVWTVVRPAPEDLIPGGQKHFLLADGSILAQGYAPTKDVSEIRVKTTVPNITAFRLELLNDPNLPLGGPGRSIKGTCALTEFDVTAAPLNAASKTRPVKIVRATADVNPPETPLDSIFDDKTGRRRVTGPIAFAIDHDDKTAWGVDIGPHRRNEPRKAVFVADKPVSFPGGTVLTFALSQRHGGWNSDDNQNNNLGRYRLSVTNAPNATADPIPHNVREILSIPREKRSPAQIAAVFSYWRTTVPEWKEANDAIEHLWRQHPEGASQFVLAKREMPRSTHMLKRGDFLKPERTVSPGVPSFLQPLPPGAPPTRLTFARWLTDRRSPTTARAIVNRVWQTYFGIGIVSTSEDLGSQAETPSHPKLLDWLAVEFMDHGWSLKWLHRQIVTSATYRQSSQVTPENYSRDPYNRLLARGPRFRVDAEIVRDIALETSGLLYARLGGPSVFPPAPDFLFMPPVSYGPKIWKEETGPNRYRRAIYTFRYRSVPYPALQTFDAPNGDFSCVRRARSNTPLQALTSLNEPLFLECARALALNTVWKGGADSQQRLTYAFRRCLSRRPTEEETSALLALYDKEAKHFASDESSALSFAANDVKHAPSLPAGTTVDELAGWTAVSRVLLNLDETITKE
jgi:mono/diheme cytochrome c family protein